MRNHLIPVRLVGLLAATLACAVPLLGQSATPSFTKSFSPAVIGPNSGATLRYTIANGSNLAITNLSFTETLPSGLAIASPARAATTCGGATLAAIAGDSTISLSGASVGSANSCAVVVNVRASGPGVFTATSGDLTSSAGNSGPSTADLTVDAARPGFLKTFSPWSVPFGSRATLILTIDNTLNQDAATGLSFTDNLPSGMTIASPANASATCNGGVLNSPAGATVLSYAPAFFGDATVDAGATCTISVDVRAGAVGWLENTTGELVSLNPQFQQRSSGRAGESLNVTIEPLALVKSFAGDPVAPGNEVTLEYTLRNLNRGSSAEAISFTDDLDGALSGLSATGLPTGEPCGAGSAISGGGLLGFSGGVLGPGETCRFNVTLTVPPAASSGVYPSATSNVTAEVDGAPLTTGPASDLLFVAPVPSLAMAFIGDPVGAGGSVAVEYTITNSSSAHDATSINFAQSFDVILPTASSVPASGFCGSGSTATFTPLSDFTDPTLTISGASLSPESSCTFSITLDVAGGAPAGIYAYGTTDIRATVDGTVVTGTPAADELEVIAAPALQKEFVDDPVPAGGTVTLEFTLTHDELASLSATEITFTDDLDAALAGLAATGLPVSDVCGTGSVISGTNNLLFSGGSLAPGESCTFSVTLQVPSSAPPGRHSNVTSAVQADLGGITALSAGATTDLLVAGLTLTKSFTDDPVLSGGSVTLEFTIANSDPAATATSISFTDDLSRVIPGLVASALPAGDPCGAGSSLVATSGGSVLVFSGGTLAAGGSCTFAATLAVPAGTPSGSYANRTSNFLATFEGQPIVFDNAEDSLIVESDLLSFSKEFLDDPVAPGDEVTLRFSITNLNAHFGISDIAFTDDLDATLSGLTASGLPASACGGAITGTSVISLSGGSVSPAGSCSFDVVLNVPEDASPGAVAENVTSTITGIADGVPVTGLPASDHLEINFLELSKEFDGPATAGGTAVLTFNITNLSATETASGLSFADNLSAVLTGLEATGTPNQDVCGTGSELTGTSFLTLSGGSLLPGGSCTFSVPLSIPASAPPGTYLNLTTDLRLGGVPFAPPATAMLIIMQTVDEDRDGVPDEADACPGTSIPEGVPTQELRTNHYALVDDDTTFDTVATNGVGPDESFTTEDTAGCSCEQIIEKLALGKGHTKFGCSLGIMRDWIGSLE